MNSIDLPGAESPRPNLASIPSMVDMLALYEKVLAELDSAISTQKDFIESPTRLEAETNS